MELYTLPHSPFYGDTFGIIQLGNNTYVVPHWYEVKEGTTRDQIQFEVVEEKVSPPPKKPKPKNQTWEVISSNGKITYIIRGGDTFSCTCPANQFRRGDCKHIKEIKSKLNS